MEKTVSRCLESNFIPLVFGPTGIGKTTFVQRYTNNKARVVRHLYCPFELDEFENMLIGVSNNPNQIVIIDNLEAADSTYRKHILTFITTKSKNTEVILICINPYDVNLRTIRSKTTLCSMPSIQASRMLTKANNHGASDTAIELIAKNNFQDYRVLRNVILDKSYASYDKDTNIALRNPFKAFSWLLGVDKKHTARLPAIVEDDPFFYSMGVFTNYTKISEDIDDIEAIASSLSDMDAIGYDSSQYQNHILALIPNKINNKKRTINTAFPNFTTTSKPQDKRWKSQEHVDMLEKRIRELNIKASKNNTEQMRNIVSSYKLPLDLVEKSIKELGVSKQTKLKTHLKKAFLY